MIPFASQRAGGQDLATHLLNACDNEYVELAQLRGAIARDPHGAFAEWQAQADLLTRCRQYLCSLSLNPDELQGRLTRAQYFEYIDRAEKKLGLAGQPRAVFFHIKEDAYGRMREHCHVVWSRVDAKAGKAVQLSFFKEKLMTVTREFARDHGIDLPDGYRRQEEKMRRRNRQLSSYDCIKQKETGISHEERMKAVTGAWKRSDSGKAFVAALEELGYVLARGDNGTRPVLVDIYGHTTALRKLLDDPAVKTRQVREFLGADYAPENLPSVDEAKTFAAQRRKAIEAFEKAREESEQVIALGRQQAERRGKLEGEAALLRERQRDQRARLAQDQKEARQQRKADYLAQRSQVRAERALHAPKGLAAFLGRITGVALITRKIHRYRDRRRFEAYIADKQQLAGRQAQERELLSRRHELQGADMERKLRALDQVEARERKGLEQARVRERRQRINERHEHMPAFTLELKPPGRKPKIEKAKNRFISPLAQELRQAALEEKAAGKKIGLAQEFERAARDEEGERSGGSESSGGQAGPVDHTAERRDRLKGELSQEFNAAAYNPDDPDDGDGGIRPEPENSGPEDDTPKPRRTRRRDLDRER